jgi:hypothetical protein
MRPRDWADEQFTKSKSAERVDLAVKLHGALGRHEADYKSRDLEHAPQGGPDMVGVKRRAMDQAQLRLIADVVDIAGVLRLCHLV